MSQPRLVAHDHASSLIDLAHQLNRLSPYRGNPERFFLDRETLAEGILEIARAIRGSQKKTAAEAGPLDSGNTTGKRTAFRQSICHGRPGSATENHGGKL